MKINWEVFSEEEKTALEKCLKEGNYNNLCCLPEVNIDTPEKEKEIEKMVLDLKEIDVDDESAVKKEIDDFWASGEDITPEKEAEFQKKIEAEKAELEKNREEEKAKVNGEEVEEPNNVVEETKVEEESTTEVKK